MCKECKKARNHGVVEGLDFSMDSVLPALYHGGTVGVTLYGLDVLEKQISAFDEAKNPKTAQQFSAVAEIVGGTLGVLSLDNTYAKTAMKVVIGKGIYNGLQGFGVLDKVSGLFGLDDNFGRQVTYNFNKRIAGDMPEPKINNM